MKLHELSDMPGATHRRKRVGRGAGSGKGVTAGRGMKGQKSRSGVALGSFEGGQMPIHMRLPKRGFNRPGAKRYAVVNLGRLQGFIDDGKIDAGKPIDAAAMLASGLVRRQRDGIRILSKGAIKAPVNIVAVGASKAAIAAVEAAGGSLKIEVQSPPADGNETDEE